LLTPHGILSSILCALALLPATAIAGNVGPVPAPSMAIQVRGFTSNNCPTTGERLAFMSYDNFTCAADGTRYQCQNGQLMRYNNCNNGCSDTSSMCSPINGGTAPSCLTTTGNASIGLSCSYTLGTSSGPIAKHMFVFSGNQCIPQSLYDVDVGSFLSDPSNTHRWQCEAGKPVIYHCSSASAGVGCGPILDTAAAPLTLEDCTVVSGSWMSGNSTKFSCDNAYDDPTAAQVIPLDFKVYSAADCTGLVSSMTDQTSLCEVVDDKNMFYQCEDRNGQHVLASYGCESSCMNATSLADAKCVDFTATAQSLVDMHCHPFGQGGRMFTCNGPIVDATASSFTILSPTKPTKVPTPTRPSPTSASSATSKSSPATTPSPAAQNSASPQAPPAGSTSPSTTPSADELRSTSGAAQRAIYSALAAAVVAALL